MTQALIPSEARRILHRNARSDVSRCGPTTCESNACCVFMALSEPPRMETRTCWMAGLQARPSSTPAVRRYLSDATLPMNIVPTDNIALDFGANEPPKAPIRNAGSQCVGSLCSNRSKVSERRGGRAGCHSRCNAGSPVGEHLIADGQRYGFPSSA
jgi:hypothetical protein